MLNAGGEGFYRVAYPPSWPAASSRSGALTPLERFVLVDDAWAAVLVGTMPATEFLDVRANASRARRDLVVWRALVARLRNLTRLVDGDALDALRAESATLVRPAFARLGWDAPDRRRRRASASSAACCSTRSARSPTTAKSSPAPRSIAIDPSTDADVVAACITVTARHGDADLFDEFAHRFRTATTPQEQLRYLYALAQFPDERSRAARRRARRRPTPCGRRTHRS